MDLCLELKSRLNIMKILDVGAKPNVMDVAAKMVTNEEMDYLERCYRGGGNPALEFFKTLIIKKCDNFIGDLKYFCGEKQMINASKILKKYDDDKQLGDITASDIHDLADATIQLHYWETLAELYGMNEDIPTFRTAIKFNDENSPTRALLRLIDTKYCDTINIGVFLEHVRKAKHTQAAGEILKQIKYIAKDMISQ